MGQTVKKVAKCVLNIATHPSFTGGALAAGNYDLNVTESLPAGAIVTGILANVTTNFAGGTTILIKVGSGAGQALTSTVATAALVTSDPLLPIAISADAHGEVITSTGDIGITSVGNYTAGILTLYIDYMY